MSADLHLHTTESDGTWTPREVVQKAVEHSLTVIAITDHDTTAGLAEAKRHAPRGLEVISGIELSTLSFSQEEIHILGYWIDESAPRLQNLLEVLRLARIERAKLILAKLKGLGITLSYDDVLQFAKRSVISRSHIASVLQGKKIVETKAQAFQKYLGPDAPAYVGRRKLSPQQAVEVILEARGIPVLAHPGLMKNLNILPALIEAGLVGLEVVHSSHDREQTKFFLQLANKWGLLPTGGSDCHGPGGKEKVFMGDFTIPLRWVEQLEKRRI